MATPPTLVDCGCKARVHGDGSGVEIDFCPMHTEAEDLLTNLEALVDELKADDRWADITTTLRHRVLDSIKSARGG